MSLRSMIISQFGRPRGPLGVLVGRIMATRPSNRARNAWTIKRLHLKPGEGVLELGCGPGLGICSAVGAGAGHVLALDHSAEMLRQAGRRCKKEIAAARVELRLGGLEALRAEDAAFDAAWMVNVAMFLPDRPATFTTIRHALAPGGRFAVTHQPRLSGASEEAARAFAATLRADFAAAGFEAIEEHLLPLEPAPAVCIVGRAPVAEKGPAQPLPGTA